MPSCVIPGRGHCEIRIYGLFAHNRMKCGRNEITVELYLVSCDINGVQIKGGKATSNILTSTVWHLATCYYSRFGQSAINGSTTAFISTPIPHRSPSAMPFLSRPPIITTIVICLLGAVHVSATALTAMLAANDRSCYYADVDGLGEKVGQCILQLLLRHTRAHHTFIH